MALCVSSKVSNLIEEDMTIFLQYAALRSTVNPRIRLKAPLFRKGVQRKEILGLFVPFKHSVI